MNGFLRIGQSDYKCLQCGAKIGVRQLQEHVKNVHPKPQENSEEANGSQ